MPGVPVEVDPCGSNACDQGGRQLFQESNQTYVPVPLLATRVQNNRKHRTDQIAVSFLKFIVGTKDPI